MARSRNVKPGFFTNEHLGELPPLVRLLFQALWCEADRDGKLEDRPKRIKAEFFPYDEFDVSTGLAQLQHSAGMFIARYEVDGRRYIKINNFKKHQNPHIREAASVIPDPPEPIENTKYSYFTIPAQCKHRACLVLAGLIPDSLIPDSLIPDSHPLFTDPSTEQMTMLEFASCYQKTFGKIMSGMLNQDALDMCRKYPAEVLHEAFRITAEAGGKSFSYLRAVLEGQQKSQDALDEVFGGAA